MSAKQFQINSKIAFLTYPQCATNLTTFQSKINQFFKDNLEKGVISQETHEDGNLHLHAAICLKKPLRSKDPRVFDGLVDPPKHPNIMTRFTGGALKAFEYVMKEGNYLPLGSGFDLDMFMEQARKKQNTKTALILKDIQEGQKLDDLVDNHAEYLLQNLRKVKEFLDFLSLREKRLQFVEAQTRKVRVMPAEGFSSSWNQEIASWLNLNLRNQRAHRQKQLWICAPPGMGKTSLIMMLEKAYDLSVYYWPKEEVWWDAYSDGAYDLIVLDEFHSQKTITQLNPILSGDPTPLSRRCSAPLTKRDNLPVIILSNYLPEECFAKVASNQPHKLAPLIDRLTIVKVDGPIRMAPIEEQEEIGIPSVDLPDDPPTEYQWTPSPDLDQFPEFDGILEPEEVPDVNIEELEAEFQRNNDPNYFGQRNSRARLLKATDSLNLITNYHYPY